MDPHQHPDLDNNIEEVASAVLGPRKSEFAGGGRYDESGLVHKVEELGDTAEALKKSVADNTNVTNEILRKLNNGGIRIRLHPLVWAAIVTALGGLVLQVIDAIWRLPTP